MVYTAWTFTARTIHTFMVLYLGTGATLLIEELYKYDYIAMMYNRKYMKTIVQT
jgi:hypothetical protein